MGLVNVTKKLKGGQSIRTVDRSIVQHR